MIDCEVKDQNGDWVTYWGKRSRNRVNRLSWNRAERRFAEGKSDCASAAFINEVLRREGVIDG